jgi:hypothetical protein
VDLFAAMPEQTRLCNVLAEMFQVAMSALHNAPDEVLSANARNGLDGGQSFAGMSDVRT